MIVIKYPLGIHRGFSFKVGQMLQETKHLKGWALCFLKHGRRIMGYNVPSNYTLKIYPGLYVLDNVLLMLYDG